MTMKIDEMN